MSSETLTREAPPAPQPEDAELGQGGRFLRWKAPLLLIAAELAVLGYLIRGSFFFADDYSAFGLAHIEGLGTTLLFSPGFDNLAPTERFLHWLALSIAPMNYGLGEAIILILTAALLVSLLWVLRELRAHPVVTLTAIFFVGTSIIVFYEAFDFDQVTFLFPASTCMLCVLALFIRWIRTGSTRFLVISWVVFGLSFLTQERLLVLPVYLVIVRYLILPYRMPPGGRKKPWADWRVWVPFGVIALAYFGYYRRYAEKSTPDYGTLFAFFRAATELFVRALIGLPLKGVPRWVAPAEWFALLVVAIAIVVACRSRRRRKALIGATLFAVVTFAVNVFVVYHGVGGVVGINGVVGQLQYYLDPMLGVAMAVGMASSPLVSAPDPVGGLPLVPTKHVAGPRHAGRGVAASHRRRPALSLGSPVVLVCAGLVVLHLALLPFGTSNVLDSQRGERLAAKWVPAVRSSLSAIDRAHTPTTVLPLTMPALFVPSGEAPFQLEQPFLALLPEWRNLDGGPVSIIGRTGRLQSARALNSVTLSGPQVVHHLGTSYFLSTHVNSSGDACFTGKTAGGQFRITLPREVRGEQIAVDLHLTTARAIAMTPFAIDSSMVTENSLPENVPAGSQRLLAALQQKAATTVGFTVENSNPEFCVQSIQVAAVGVLSSAGAKDCRRVDVYGSPVGTRETCGVSWQ